MPRQYNTFWTRGAQPGAGRGFWYRTAERSTLTNQQYSDQWWACIVNLLSRRDDQTQWPQENEGREVLNIVKEENGAGSCSTTRWSKHITSIKAWETDPVLMSYRTHCYQVIRRGDKFLRFGQVEERFTYEANSLVEVWAVVSGRVCGMGMHQPCDSSHFDGCLLPLCVHCATFQAVGFFTDCWILSNISLCAAYPNSGHENRMWMFQLLLLLLFFRFILKKWHSFCK